MRLLLVDTSGASCSVALTKGEQVVAEYSLRSDKPLSSRILDSVDLVLKAGGTTLAELDGIGVALGPGAFTGLRVGIATVKGLALAASIPAVGFSSLAMLAMNLPWAYYPVCSLFDARKKEVYAAVYRCRDLPEALLPDAVLPPEQLLQQIDTPTIFVGDGAVAYRDLIVSTLGEHALFAPASCHLPRASAAAPLVKASLLQGGTPLPLLNPSYIRPSEAELVKLRMKI